MKKDIFEPLTREEFENAREYLDTIDNKREYTVLRLLAWRLIATVDQMRTGQEPHNTIATHATFNKVAEVIRKKVKSITDWGWDPSGTDETRALDEARNEAKQVVRQAMEDIADAFEEALQ